MGILMVVPPLVLTALEILVPTAAACVAVSDVVIPLGNTTLPSPSLPLGSAQFIPLKPFVLVVVSANGTKLLFATFNWLVTSFFLEHAERYNTLIINNDSLKLFLIILYLMLNSLY
jgi:hypothetical protein